MIGKQLMNSLEASCYKWSDVVSSGRVVRFTQIYVAKLFGFMVDDV